MVWVITALVILGSLGLILFLGWLTVKYVQRVNVHQQAEDFFAAFTYSDDEWRRLYEVEFVEDQRGKRFTDKYASVISTDNDRGDGTRKIDFSDRGIYITGDGKRKSFAVNRLSINGDGVHFISMRLLPLSPMNKLQINVKVDVDLADYRVNHDLDYLVPIPRSAADKIHDIIRRYEHAY